jgi:pyruvate/2-oxoglutarate/acetoin dehydrogenase E1 component
MGEDIGLFGGKCGVTKGLFDEFGEDRIVDTPISEGGYTSMAIGAAMYGYRPVVEIMFADFSTYAMDAIVNQAAKQRFMMGGQVNMPITIRMPGGSGTAAAAQHSQSPEAWFCHVPGLIVVSPSTPKDAKGLLKSAIRRNDPVLFFEHKLGYSAEGEVPEGEYTTPLFSADIKREGSDVTVISYSYNIQKCLRAAQTLEKEGVEVEVVDLVSLNPIDTETIIKSAKKTGRVLITHEAVQKCGVGAEVAAVIASSDAFFELKKPVERFCGSDDMPVPYSPELEKQIIPQADSICERLRALLK